MRQWSATRRAVGVRLNGTKGAQSQTFSPTCGGIKTCGALFGCTEVGTHALFAGGTPKAG